MQHAELSYWRKEIYTLLASEPERAFTPSEIAFHLNMSRSYARLLLRRMTQDAQIFQTARGWYGITQSAMRKRVARRVRKKEVSLGSEIAALPEPLPAVYVRYLEETDEYYIGQATDLRYRYSKSILDQLIYWEVVPDRIGRQVREATLLREFIECGLSVANRDMIVRQIDRI